MLNQSERAMSAIACRHCDDVVVGAPARITDDICKTFNVTAVVFEGGSVDHPLKTEKSAKRTVSKYSRCKKKHFSREENHHRETSAGKQSVIRSETKT